MSVKTFNYFAYGSNLLSKRIHIQNPSAVRFDKGKLKNFRLDFITYSKRWQGASATIVPDENHHVWGAVWKINEEDLPNLDQQEGVHINIYKPLEVDVELTNGTTIRCRTYMQTAIPDYVENIELLPFERQPSGIYIKTILQGAVESQLPEKYIRFLQKIPSNKNFGEPSLRLELNIV